MVIVRIVGWFALALSGVGCAYMLAAAMVLHRFMARASQPLVQTTPVTILKPLYGAEPRLAENLATFLDQRHAGAIQLLGGVHSADDAALPRIAPLGERIEIVVDPAVHGANGKITNCVNMTPAIRHPVVILSDSDIAVAPDYLGRLLAALDQPGVGAVTCLYRGRGDAGFWSQLCAAGLSYQFLPGAAFGAASGLAQPCMGSTIALRRDTLERIGGFSRFADTLADDHAIGAALRELGLATRVPAMLVVHACDETSLGAVWRHELRWAATVRDLAPVGYAASVIALPLPLALIGAALAPGTAAVALILLALVARLLVRRTVDGVAGATTAPAWLLPLRDVFSLAVFVASFVVQSVDWRRRRLRMDAGGRIAA